jgi:hypothetical protein
MLFRQSCVLGNSNLTTTDSSETLMASPAILFNQASVARLIKATEGRTLGIATSAVLSHAPDFWLYGALRIRLREAGGAEHSQVLFMDGRDSQSAGELRAMLRKSRCGSFLFKRYDSPNVLAHGLKDGEFPGKRKTCDLGPWHPSRMDEFYAVLEGRYSRIVQGRVQGIPILESIRFVRPTTIFARAESEF